MAILATIKSEAGKIAGKVANKGGNIIAKASGLSYAQLEKFKNKLYKIGEQGYQHLTPAVRSNWELVLYEIKEDNHTKNIHSQKYYIVDVEVDNRSRFSNDLPIIFGYSANRFFA